MYLTHYNLRQMPFQISPDPRFLWLGEKHREALAVLKYGILNNQGFLLLTGDVGTGKTTLIHALVNSLASDTIFINVPDPHLDKVEFFKLVAHSFGLEGKLTTKLDFLVSLKKFLCRAHDGKKKVLLIIDEAQKLSLDLLEEIRLLSNVERQDTKLLNVFFIGQNEFNDILVRPECRALRQRITIVHNIESLNEKETAEYVQYRLNIAGTEREIFTDTALRKIYAFSKGYPRLINIICDRALLTAYSKDLKTVGHKIIRECAKELSLPGEIRQELSSTAAQRIRNSLSRAARVALFAGVALVLTLSVYGIASRFLGDHGFSLRQYYGTFFSSPERVPAGRPSKGISARETDRSSPPSTLPSKSSNESHGQRAPDSANHGNRTPEIGNPAGLETSEQDNVFQKSRLVIPFEYKSNEILPEALARLDELARYMLRRPDAEIVIRGYTDSMGSADYNRNLSAFRAHVVGSYLAGKGISSNRMTVIGMGDGSPLMPNTTPEGRSANRRVEIEVAPQKPQG